MFERKTVGFRLVCVKGVRFDQVLKFEKLATIDLYGPLATIFGVRVPGLAFFFVRHSHYGFAFGAVVAGGASHVMLYR